MTRATQDELLRALAAIAGIPAHEIGPTVAKRLNKQLSVIRESTPDVTIEEMRARYRKHRHLWPTCTITPESLAKHWPELSPTPKLVPVDSEAIPEPEGWRDHATAILTDIDPGTALYLAFLPWSKLPPHLRTKIARDHVTAPNVIPVRFTA